MSDIKVELIKTGNNYVPGNISMNDINIHLSDLDDILEFIVNEAKIHHYKSTIKSISINSPDYYIDILITDNILSIDVDTNGIMDSQLFGDAVKFANISDLQKDEIKNEAIKLAKHSKFTKIKN
jgi:hypothetical protein